MMSKSKKSGYFGSRKLGLVRAKGKLVHLNMNGLRLGDQRAEVLAEGIRLLKTVSSLDLSSNGITKKGAETVLSRLHWSMNHLNLSDNKIGMIGVDHIIRHVLNPKTTLLNLNISGNKLGSNAISQLCKSISLNKTLKVVDFSRNFIMDNTAGDLAEMISLNPSIKELYLHWNQIKGAGAALIFKAIEEKPVIKVLDMSWNNIGNHDTCTATLCSLLKNNSDIVHLNLSHNNFTPEESEAIGEALFNNHTLYGFHFEGHYGYIDNLGFYIAQEKELWRTASTKHERIFGVRAIAESQ